MLPTKGYFQDIECPFNNTTCGRPYCHFRHKRKPNENVEDAVQETTKNIVPTYKPTPKSELANIHNNKSHIPISYVPDLAFKRERTVRPIPRIEKPTYKPTPLSILSSANKLDTSLPENHEHKETIKDIQENIASNVYDPLKSEINFEDLSNEFDLIDDIINDTDEEPSSSINDNLIKLESDIEKEQNKLNLLQSEFSTSDLGENESDSLPKISIKTEITSPKEAADTEKSPKFDVSNKIVIKKEKLDGESPDREKKDKTENKSSEKNDKKSDKEIRGPSKDKSKVSNEKPRVTDKFSSSKERINKELSKDKEKMSVIEKTSKSHKSSEREKHRKEEKKNSSKESKESSKDKHKSKHKNRDRSKSPKESKKDKKKSKHRKESSSNSESISKEKKKGKRRTDSSSDFESSSDSSIDRNQKTHKKEKKSRSRSNKGHSTERSRSKNGTKEKDRKSRAESTSRSRSRSVGRKESKSKLKSRQRSGSKSRLKEKDKKRSRSREKDKEKRHKSREKDKDRSKSSSKEKDSKSRLKKSHEDQKEKRKKSTSESNTSQFDNDNDIPQSEDVPMVTDDLIPSDIDLDLEDEDETMRECYKIFNEYKPMPVQAAAKVEEIERKDLFEEDNTLYVGKKRTAHAGAEISSSYSKLPPPPKPKSVPLPGQILTNRYKIAQMAQGSNEQENIMNEVRSITQQPTKRPATSLLEAARQHKIKKLQQERLKEKEKEKSSASIVDNILNGVHTPSPSQVKVAPKKIAAVPNVALIEKARERISLIKQQRMQSVKTVAQTKKGGRVAHVPEFTLSDIPDVLQADKSKLPVNVRTRFLTMIADECTKLYALKEDAYNRALNEEFACYEKCKVLATYRNSAMLAVNRLRKELQDREGKGLGRLLSGETTTTEKEPDFKGKRFYEHVRKWILTEEELDIHGYPRESGERGKAIINNRKEVDYSITDDNYRKCSRCSRLYQVDDDGWPLYEEECMYHPLKKRTIRGEQVFLCCKSSDDTGCVTSDTHVFDGLKEHLLEGYQTTLPPESDDDSRSIAVYALDCEMCYTTKGLELTRVTIVDIDSKTVYESFVKPLNPIIDYNTRFSGITKDQMDRTSTSILQIQANILHLCNSETILVGHSLESDMKALKIVHATVIDTSVLFPHKMGLPHKRALRALASEYLKKIIQNDVSGHDSAEDAITCMELIKWKLKEELKTRTK